MDVLISIRDAVNKEFEIFRKGKANLKRLCDISVIIRSGLPFPESMGLGEILKGAQVTYHFDISQKEDEFFLVLDEADGFACPRCWNRHFDDNFGFTNEQIIEFPELSNQKLCNRCKDAVVSDFPLHWSVDYIVNYGKE